MTDSPSLKAIIDAIRSQIATGDRSRLTEDQDEQWR